MLPVQLNRAFEIQKDEIQIRAPLPGKAGEGNFSDIYVGEWQGGTVAVKVFHLKALPGNLNLCEFDPHRTLKHPNLAEVYGVCLYPGNFSMVMELASLTMDTYLKSRNNPLPESELLSYAEDIGSGLSFLHLHNLPHKHLKAKNVLLVLGRVEYDEKTDQLVSRITAKLCDYGLSKIKLESSSNGSVQKGETIKWRAPETFGRGFTRTNDIVAGHKAADVYSYGMLLWTMLSGKPPFEALSEGDCLSLGAISLGEEIDAKWPEFYRNLIQDCWSKVPSERPTAPEIVNQLHGRAKELKALKG